MSHLFLSSAEKQDRGRGPRPEAVVLIAAGRSAGRARLAAGAAAAFAREGSQVSVCELAANLPNVGYYFGLEPADYLAPALNRSALVSGVWNGSIRFGSSLDPRSLARFSGAPVGGERSHVLVAACAASEGAGGASSVVEVLGPFSANPGGAQPAPDAIVVASGDGGWGMEESLLRDLRARWPGALFILVTRSDTGDPAMADERFVFPADFEAASARRSPPTDALYGELASVVLQRLGSRRRCDARHPAHI